MNARPWSFLLQGCRAKREDFFGTGFIVAQNEVLTNHHVAQPWWKNDEMSAAAQQGLQPTIAEMTAYFPEAAGGIPLSVSQISDEADLAVLRGTALRYGARRSGL